MDRVLESELMDDSKQAEAYARADFAEENHRFVELFKDYFQSFRKEQCWILAAVRLISLFDSPHCIQPVKSSALMRQVQ